MKNISSIHVPKAGGSSFKEYAKRNFGEQNCHFVYKEIGTWFYEADEKEWKNYLANLPTDTTQFIQGHYPYNFFYQFDPQADFITWMRDPVDRLISEYYFLLRNYWSFRNDERVRQIHEQSTTLGQFALAFDNYYHAYYNVDPEINFDFTRFRFLGITEEYDRSIQLFNKIYNLHCPIAKVSENINPFKNHQGQKYQISQKTRDTIEESNALDILLYEAGVRYFHELCEKYKI